MKTKTSGFYFYTFSGIENREPDNSIISNPEKWLKEKMNGSRYSFGMDNLTRYGTFKLLGVAYDFNYLWTY